MILDLAARRAELSPDRPAVFAAGRWHTYADLNRRAGALASRLHQAGVRKGDRVAIAAHNHLAHLDLILASAKLGHVYTPLNHRLSESELRQIGDYLRPQLLFFDQPNVDKAAAAGSHSALHSLTDYDSWLETAGKPPPAPELEPGDTQMILLTGGTTGLPKGAMLPYRQGFYNAVNTVFSWGLRDDDCVIQATPCFHAAVNAFTLPLLHLGGRVVLQESFDPGAYLQLLQEHGATIMFLVPTMFSMLARHEDFGRADLSGIRWAISGGAPCPESIRERYLQHGVAFRQGYGLTEAGVNCFSIEPGVAARKPLSVGRPMLHAQAAIRNEDGTETKPGEVGELTLRGPHVFSGYFERPDETDRVLRDGWLWTGDLARQDEDGDYYLVGRRKSLFISGGENVYPAEIENVLSSHPQVTECAVMGVPDDEWGESGLAAVVPSPGAELDAGELQEWLRTRLARYKVPKKVIFLQELPKSAAGKVLSSRILEIHQEES